MEKRKFDRRKYYYRDDAILYDTPKLPDRKHYIDKDTFDWNTADIIQKFIDIRLATRNYIGECTYDVTDKKGRLLTIYQLQNGSKKYYITPKGYFDD